MTADIELLPLPEGVDVIFSPDGNGAALDVFTPEQVQDYARANVAHATAAKDAEIEALRAEVGQEQDYAAGAARRVLMAQIAQRRAEARAERLAEALRLIAAPIRPDGTWNRDREACRQIARDALRDHDQEVGNG